MTKLKIGDNVVMNDRYYDKHQGEVFTIKAGPEMIGRKECFWLDGYDGAYCADGLDLYKPPTNEEWLKSLDTEGLVDYLYEVHKGGNSVERQRWIENHKERVKMQFRGWLKEKHDG